MIIGEKKHITEPDKHGFQVRIVRKGIEHSRYFSHNAWGDKEKSLLAAQSWRDQQLVRLGKKIKSLVGLGALGNNKTTGIRGVTKSITYDKRRNTEYLIYQVHWKDRGKVKNRKFQVGRVGQVSADEELHAFRTAVQFRKAYEFSVENDQVFAPEHYVNWKKERVYDWDRDQISRENDETVKQQKVSKNESGAMVVAA